jgi:hypothetical protein
MSGALIGGESAAMQQALQRSSLVPSGFVVESAYYQGNKAIITVRASGSVGLCPSCGTVSRRVHSRYRRRVTDLPLSGRIVQLLGSPAASVAMPSRAGVKSSLSALLKGFWLHRLDAGRGYTLSSIILVWRLADDRRHASQNG